ncbi:hypothetical protein JVU11DRAFT_2869 [Chiua virens]|nr:hypothetical protein JVU11DRAFT_2869 [Chiua virens]
MRGLVNDGIADSPRLLTYLRLVVRNFPAAPKSLYSELEYGDMRQGSAAGKANPSSLHLLGAGIASMIAGYLLLIQNEPCQQIADSISAASEVYNVASVKYLEHINHWATSSTQSSACSFEPGTTEDISIALRILGQTKTPFAVKGGGHTSNPGFSSTPGVQISMTKFSEVSYDCAGQTVTVGAGLVWDNVYAALEPYGVNVVGGRVSGVGVAGFTLGGGYSWLTNQYGLTIDTVQAFEVVLPNSTVVNVTETSSPDVFFALKGGLNNFGIVTKFTLKVFPQAQVWGGFIVYTADVIDQVNQATANFAANNSDPKAAIITAYNYVLGRLTISEIIFYDAPSPPDGLFDEFLSISSFAKVISTRSFLSFVSSIPVNGTYGTRVVFNTISVTSWSLSLIESIVNETVYWGKKLVPESAVLISYDVAPFLPTFLSHNTSPSAYPPSRAKGFLPLEIYYAWESPSSDKVFQDTARTSASTLKAQTIASGQPDVANAPLYPNYAIFDTPLADLYGANLARLQTIKAAVDPKNIMGLAGGFKL